MTMALASRLGISVLLAPGLIARALADAGARSDDASSEDLLRSLPHLRRRLSAYLSPEEADARVATVRAFVLSNR
jgi:hypothetical protein